MVFRNKLIRSPKKAAKVAPEPIPERKRTAEIPPRKVQHSFINADTKVTGDLKSGGDISVEGSVEGNISCRTLTLRGEPTITGDVHAEAVHVCGRFEGAPCSSQASGEVAIYLCATYRGRWSVS